MTERPVDYARLSYQWQQHHRRFVAHVEAHGLPCQACGGMGGETDVIVDGQGPWEPCGWCEGAGMVTKWLRGLYLRTMRAEKRKQTQEAAA